MAPDYYVSRGQFDSRNDVFNNQLEKCFVKLGKTKQFAASAHDRVDNLSEQVEDMAQGLNLLLVQVSSLRDELNHFAECHWAPLQMGLGNIFPCFFCNMCCFHLQHSTPLSSLSSSLSSIPHVPGHFEDGGFVLLSPPGSGGFSSSFDSIPSLVSVSSSLSSSQEWFLTKEAARLSSKEALSEGHPSVQGAAGSYEGQDFVQEVYG